MRNFSTTDKDLENALSEFSDDYFKSEKAWNKVVELIYCVLKWQDCDVYFRFLEKDAAAFGDSWISYATKELDFWIAEKLISRQAIKRTIAEHCIFDISWSKFLEKEFDTRDVKIFAHGGIGFIL